MRSHLAYILKEDGRSGSVQNGVVTFSNAKKPLRHSPMSIKKMQIAWERNLARHGVNRNFTFPFDLVRDARIIIQDTFYNRTIDEKLFLLIQKRALRMTDTTYKWIYEYLFKGELDLPTVRDAEVKLGLAIMEGGLHKQIKANEGTKYDIDFDEDSMLVAMDGIDISNNSTFLSTSIFQTANPFWDTPGARQYNLYWIPVVFINNDGTIVNGAGFSTLPGLELHTNTNHDDAGNPDNYFFKATAAITIRIKFEVTATIENAASVELYIKNSNGTRTSLFTLTSDAPGGGFSPFSKSQTYTVDEEITLAADEKLYFLSQLEDGIGIAGPGIGTFTEFQFSVSFTSKYRTTYIKALSWKNAMKKVLLKMGINPETKFVSTLLDANPGLFVTSGDAIRGIVGARIKLSYNDLYKNIDCNLFAGMGIKNDQLFIEDRTEFYDTSDPIELGEVRKHEVSYAENIVCNTYKAGHGKPDIEDVNGKYEFNGSDIFGSTLEKVVREYDIESPFRSSPYEIEITRINLEGKTTTDNNSDGGVFNLDVLVPDPEFTTAALFYATSTQIGIPIGHNIQAGMKIKVTGSTSNDNIYSVITAIDNGSTQVLTVDIPVVNESAGAITIEIIGTLICTLNRPAYTTEITNNGITGELFDSIFNIRFSPKRILQAHYRWIRSMLFKFEDQKVTFKSGSNNTTLKTTLAGVTVDEDSDIDVGDMGDPMFLPYYHEFETKVPVAIIELLEENPNRAFKWLDDGDEYIGFSVQIGVQPSDNAPQKYKMLSAPTNDLTRLIGR
jgi:hypothetical protein